MQVKPGRQYMVKNSLWALILSVCICQPTIAQALDFSAIVNEVKETMDEKIYLRELNDEFFNQSHMTKAQAQETPLGPKASSLAFSQARGTPFKEFPKPEGFDQEQFKKDMEVLKQYVSNKVGGEVIKEKIKQGKEKLSQIKEKVTEAQNPKEFVEDGIKKLFGKETKTVASNAPYKETTVITKVKMQNSIFLPERKRPNLGPAYQPIGLKKERQY